MAKELAPIIIKKKKAGHGGHHGGAWKVAYADFVTAMMAFFLVMWLMGSDEETKAAVSHYFNNPTSAWRKDVTTKDITPLGDRTGAGQNVVNGANGSVPDDLVERPVRPMNQNDIEGQKVGEILESFLSSDNLASLDMIRFSVPEDLLFRAGTTDKWSDQADPFLKKLGELTRQYKGKLVVQTTSSGPKPDSPLGSYEFQMSRAVAVANFVVKNQWAREEQVSAVVHNNRREPASTRKIEFTLSRDR